MTDAALSNVVCKEQASCWSANTNTTCNDVVKDRLVQATTDGPADVLLVWLSERNQSQISTYRSGCSGSE